jgi:tRNA threonylcarbamoyladenosine biosynthesis protein TsaE
VEWLTSPELVLQTAGADQTRALAGAIAPLCQPGDMLLLAGDLGAGKTTFAQGFGAGLGITETITSPTFTLVRHYAVSGHPPLRTLLHADVYRLDRLQEIVDLGLGELVDDGGVALVEWGDVAEPVLGEGSLAITLLAAGHDDHRVISVRAAGTTWCTRWTALQAALAPWGATP